MTQSSLGCSVVAAVLWIVTTTPTAAAADAPSRYDEPFRPQFHFSPEKNWMNDPNGLVYSDGEWHLFYQYNPFGDQWGHMSWGHAVSKDLFHWEHLPIALREEGGVMMFSGSAVVDHKNTSGFGKDGKPPLVAIYTGHGLGKQTQDIAYSNDRGRTWTKFEGNPVIDIASPEFRDPKVMWHEPTKQWVMVVARSDRRTVMFYGSTDLKKWAQLSEFGGRGATSGVWECPDLFELPVSRAGAPTGARRWVLVVNVSDGAPAGGPGCQYFVGQFDGKTFVNEDGNGTLWADYGADFYAAQSWSDVPERDGRRIWVAWMSNPRYTGQAPTKPWRSAMSMPRELSLVETAQGVRLAQRVVKEAGDLVATRAEDGGIATPVTLHDVTISAGEDPLKGKVSGETLELMAIFEDVEAEEVGFKVRVGGGQETVVGYDAKKKEFFVDRTKSGLNFHREFARRHAAPAPDAEGKVMLHLWVDRSSVEVLGQGGLVSMSELIYPEGASRGVELYAEGGRAKVKTLNVRKLKSVWR